MFDHEHYPKLVRIAFKLVIFLVYSVKLGNGLCQKVKLFYIFMRWKLIIAVGHRLTRWLPLPDKIKLIFNGTPLLISIPDDLAFPETLYELFVREDYKVDFAQAPQCILDVGANFGLASLYFSALHPGVTIHAFEPSSNNFHLLKANTQPFPKICLHQMGLFSLTGKAKLYIKDSGGENSLLAKGDRYEEINITTLDEFLASHQINHVDLMKIDVEGSEEEILTSSKSLKDFDFIVGELHLKMIKKEKILKALDPYFTVVCKFHAPNNDVLKARNKKLGGSFQ